MASGFCIGIPYLLAVTQVSSCYRLCKRGATAWDNEQNIDIQNRRWGVVRTALASLYYVAIMYVMAVAVTVV